MSISIESYVSMLLGGYNEPIINKTYMKQMIDNVIRTEQFDAFEIVVCFTLLEIINIQLATKLGVLSIAKQSTTPCNIISNKLLNALGLTKESYDEVFNLTKSEIAYIPHEWYEEEVTLFIDHLDILENTKLIIRNFIKVPRDLIDKMFKTLIESLNIISFDGIKKPEILKFRYVVGKEDEVEAKCILVKNEITGIESAISTKKSMELPIKWLLNSIYKNEEWSCFTHCNSMSKSVFEEPSKKFPKIRVCTNDSKSRFEFEIEDLNCSAISVFENILEKYKTSLFSTGKFGDYFIE